MFVCSLQFLISLLKPALTEFWKKYVAPIATKNYFSFSKDIFNFIWSSFLILNCVQRYTFGYQEWFSFNTMSIWILDDLPSTLQNRSPRVTLLYGPRIPVCTRCITYMYGIYVRCIFVFQIFSINGALVLCWPNQQYIYLSFNRD